jgi:hypothetical protein
LSQKIRKSGAAVDIEASAAATSWEQIAPDGLAWVGTTHMPLTVGSSRTSASTEGTSGPSGFIGTVTMSMPKSASIEKCRS